MQYRVLGKTGLTVSALGFGCGAVGGLLVRGEWPTMLAAVERAVEAGITYFDTAQMYGSGQSESNLGRVLQILKPSVMVGTKVQLTGADLTQIENAVIRAAEVSLQRLQLEQLDLFQLHNPIGPVRQPARGWVTPADVAVAISALEKLRAQGKIRFWGINGLGDTDAIHQVMAQQEAATIQVCYNLLNPSAGRALPPDFPFQDYRQLISRAAERQMGVIGIRVLAAGALSGQAERHPVAAQNVAPIATHGDFAADVASAQRFAFLVDEGWVVSLVEAAIRFALSQPGIATALVGFSSLEQLEQAIAAAEKGPLPAAVVSRIVIGER
jgi:L-galactose dehydrogenase/L-glyceraldehyde 3-phosphate reductase